MVTGWGAMGKMHTVLESQEILSNFLTEGVQTIGTLRMALFPIIFLLSVRECVCL